MLVTRIMYVLGIICVFAAITAMLASFITRSTFSVEAQQTVGVNVSIVKDAALKGDKAYQPNPINVTIGQEVIWTNDDSQIHTVTSGTGPSDPQLGELFDSGILSPGDTFRYVFNQTGEIPYYCTLHPLMVGTIESAPVQQNPANISSLGQMMTEDEGAIQRGGGQGMSGMSGMTQGEGEMQHGGGGGGQGMSGMSGMTQGEGEMQHGGGGQGMSGMSGGMEQDTGDTPGMIKEMGHMGEDMPPHYCEPSYQVMSSVKGVKISDVAIVNDTSVMVTVSELNPMSNNTVEDIVIVGGGGDLAGSTLLEGNWKQNTTSTLNLMGTGSVYSTNKLTVHLFPFND